MAALEYDEDGGWGMSAWTGFESSATRRLPDNRSVATRSTRSARMASLKKSYKVGMKRDANLRIWSSTPDRPVLWKHVFAAAAAGSVLTMTTFPLSTIKTHMQAGLHTSFVGCVVKVVRKDGVRKLYSGVGIDLVQNLPYSFLYVSTFETLKSFGMPRLVAAAAGSAASCIVTVPADMVTQRMQVGLHTSAKQAIGAILQSNGIKGLYSGLLPAFLRILPNAAIQWTVYENLKEILERRRGGRRMNSCESLILGGISGCASAIATCPMDVLKTRLQTNLDYCNKGVCHAMKHIVAHEGYGAVFAGLVPRTLLVFPTTAIFFCVFEYMKHRLYSRTHHLGLIPLEKGRQLSLFRRDLKARPKGFWERRRRPIGIEVSPSSKFSALVRGGGGGGDGHEQRPRQQRKLLALEGFGNKAADAAATCDCDS